jgi:hypothetical protein
MLKRPLFLVLISVLVLAGCSQSGGVTPTPQAEARVETPGAYPYPVPTRSLYYPPEPQAYPGPATTQAVSAIPEPGQDTGVVIGKLIHETSGEPLGYQVVYLGQIIYLTPGPDYNYSLQQQSSPHTTAAEDGTFVLDKVPPGKYILIIFSPEDITVVMQPNTARELDIMVEAGQLLDLGEQRAIPPTE